MVQSKGARSYKRALVIRLGGLGDILLATPTIRALSEAFAGIEIDVVVGDGLSEVLSGLPYINKVIEFKKQGRDAHPQEFMAFLRMVRGSRYDLFINLHPSAKTVLIGQATGAATRISFSKDRRRQKETGRVRHAIHDFYKELAVLGISGTLDRAMDFHIPRCSAERVDALLDEQGIGGEDLLVVVNPAATRLVNRWPVDRFAAVCDRLARQEGLRVAVTGAPADRATVSRLKERAGYAQSLVDLCGRLSIKELGALLARANGFLTCDTGPLHIAAALDTPLVCLSGAADPDRTGPLSPRSRVLIDRTLPCVPCQDKRCRFGEDIRCMAGLSVSAVYQAVMEQIGAEAALRPISAAI